MLRHALRLWRSHPIAVAALIGALFGAGDAIAIESGGLMHRNSGGVLPLLWPAYGSHANPANALQIAFLLLIEVAANVLVFAALFALLVALVLGIRRILKGKNEPTTAPAGRQCSRKSSERIGAGDLRPTVRADSHIQECSLSTSTLQRRTPYNPTGLSPQMKSKH